MTLRRMCRGTCLSPHCWYNSLHLRACLFSRSSVCRCRTGLGVCGGEGNTEGRLAPTRLTGGLILGYTTTKGGPGCEALQRVAGRAFVFAPSCRACTYGIITTAKDYTYSRFANRISITICASNVIRLYFLLINT